jgi:hypothetical protein
VQTYGPSPFRVLAPGDASDPGYGGILGSGKGGVSGTKGKSKKITNGNGRLLATSAKDSSGKGRARSKGGSYSSPTVITGTWDDSGECLCPSRSTINVRRLVRFVFARIRLGSLTLELSFCVA